MNRRQFLILGGAGAATLQSASWAASRALGRLAPRRLVVIVLDGGNDGLNTLAPVGDDLYQRARPSLALAPEEVHRIDEHWGFHPSLHRLADRFGREGVALLRGVGYPNANLSHFRSMDIWSSASTELPMPTTGWLGRLVDAIEPGVPDPIALLSVGSVGTPLAMRAERHMAYAIPGVDGFRVQTSPDGVSDRVDARRREALRRMNGSGGDPRTESVAAAVGSAQASIERIETALRIDSASVYPPSRLGENLRLVAKTIRAELPTRCFHLTQGGYDTHAAQASTHAELLSTLDAALDAFLNDLADAGRLEDTLVLVTSEFGRRVAQNGVADTSGTDHGAGSLALLFGGGILPGLHGPAPDLADLDVNGNLRHAVDFRALYADVIESWFGVESEPILGARYQRAGVLTS